MSELTGKQLQQLHQALLSAFPTRADLAQMVLYGLNERLDAIATGNQNTTIFELIEWAKTKGRLHELIQKAHRQNPGNPELRQFLGTLRDPHNTPATTLPTSRSIAIQRYLEGLIEYTGRYLIERQPVPLSAKDTRDALRTVFKHSSRSVSPVRPASAATAQAAVKPDRQFGSFHEAFTACRHRMLLLGDPGAGKSTTLHEVAFEAAEERLQDPSRPIPILIALDEIQESRFSQLPPDGLAPLLQNHAAEHGAEIFRGEPLLYILDGLDEMGGERPIDLNKPEGDKFDPRSEFLLCLQQQLPGEPLVVSCRVADYNQLQQKVLLPGAATLLPLSNEKIEEFLVTKQNQPHLWTTIAADEALLDLARTPLLLALLSGAVGDSQDAINLYGANDLIDFYIERRYQHEAAKHPVPYTLDETRSLLGTIAMRMWEDAWEPLRSLSISELEAALNGQTGVFLEFVRTIHLLEASSSQSAWEFPHLAFRDRLAVPSLIQALADGDQEMRYSAAYALDKIGPAAAAAVPALIKALGDGDSNMRDRAARALGNIGPAAAAAVPDLILTLEDRFDYMRSSSASALGKIGPAAAIPALIEALGDADEDVRDTAISALGALEPMALIIALGNENQRVRYYAADAVAKIGPEASAAVPALVKALGDTDEDVRDAATRAPGNIGLAAVPALTMALGDDNPNRRSSAASALGMIGPDAAGAVKALIQALDDDDDQVRFSTALALGKIGPAVAEAVPSLIVTLGDNDRYVRDRASEALDEIGPATAEAVPALIAALGDADGDVRSNAANALANIGREAAEAVPALIVALSDANDYVRSNAALALGNIGPEAAEAVPALIEAIEDTDVNVRSNAYEALDRIGPATASISEIRG